MWYCRYDVLTQRNLFTLTGCLRLLCLIKCKKKIGTVNNTSDYTFQTYRSYFNSISANIELQVYSVKCKSVKWLKCPVSCSGKNKYNETEEDMVLARCVYSTAVASICGNSLLCTHCTHCTRALLHVDCNSISFLYPSRILGCVGTKMTMTLPNLDTLTT
jgi:hypothetical protein